MDDPLVFHGRVYWADGALHCEIFEFKQITHDAHLEGLIDDVIHLICGYIDILRDRPERFGEKLQSLGIPLTGKIPSFTVSLDMTGVSKGNVDVRYAQ